MGRGLMLGTEDAARPGQNGATLKKSTAARPDDCAVEPTEQQISSPLVLQCAACRTIVGDTCTLMDLNSEFRTITTQSIPHLPLIVHAKCAEKGEGAMVEEMLHTSMTGMDYGSTYHMLKCRHCGAVVGRMYRTTSPELDHWRGLYTFSSDGLCFYELSGHIAPSTPTMMVDGEGGTTTSPTARRSVEGNGVEITKALPIPTLQKFCLYLYERVAELEEKLSTTMVKSWPVEARLQNAETTKTRKESSVTPTSLGTRPVKIYQTPTRAPETPEEGIPSTGEVKKRGRGRPRKQRDPEKTPEINPSPVVTAKSITDRATPLKQVYANNQDPDFQT